MARVNARSEKSKPKMKFQFKGITGRWLLNSLGLTLLLVVSIGVIAAVSIYSWFYNSMQQTLTARSQIYATLFQSAYGDEKTESIEKAAREFVENFTDKEKMELMILDRNGRVLITSNGFEPDENAAMSDYAAAVNAVDNTGTWIGRQASGEKVIAVTRRFRMGRTSGAIRLVSSTTRLDRQIFIWVAGILLVGISILFCVIMTGSYFVNSIVNPVKQITLTAKQVAKGDFSARLQKRHDDELGELCDTVNYMAQELAATEKMKNDFISSVSHELRTPLTAIKGWAETIDSVNPAENREMVEKGLHIISKETERLSGLVEDLLDFSRMQSGRLTMMKDKMDLLAELEEAVYMFHERASRDRITIEYSAPETLPPVLGDRNRIKQVFINILSNAIKYSSGGGRIGVSASQDQDELVVAISDDGCGIAPEDLPKVKEKFYKANTTRSGSGIGLAIADEIVKMHGGTLDIASVLDLGTTVTIRLPVYHARGELMTSEIVPLPQESKPTKRKEQ